MKSERNMVVVGSIDISKVTGIPAGVKWRVRQSPEKFATVSLKWPDGTFSHHYLLHDSYGGYIMSLGSIRETGGLKMQLKMHPNEVESKQWAISSDGEHYDGDFPTKQAAISEGREFYQGDAFYVGELEHPTSPEDFFDCEDWLETVNNQDDYMGEHAEDWDVSTKEQRQELTAEVRKVMALWLDRHKLRPTFWNVTSADYIDAIEENKTI